MANNRRKNRSKILVYGRDLQLGVLDEPSPEEGWIHLALLRWADWCRERKVRGSCDSAEGRYRHGRVVADDAPRSLEGALISVEECKEVNGALLHIPEQKRDALAARYFLRLPDNVLCRRFKIKGEEYSRFMREARLLLQSTLLSRRHRGILAGTTRIQPSNDETQVPDGRAPHTAAKGVPS